MCNGFKFVRFIDDDDRWLVVNVNCNLHKGWSMRRLCYLFLMDKNNHNFLEHGVMFFMNLSGVGVVVVCLYICFYAM